MISLDNSCDLQQLLSDPGVAARNEKFLSECSIVYHTPSDRLGLCVMQGECATIATAGTDLLVGSQDATTCIVAVLACPITTVVWVAHLDDLDLGCQDVSKLESAFKQMQQPQLYLAGGYCEASGRGPRLAQSFLQLLRILDPRIQVQLCCVGAVNTAADGSPRCCQLVLDTSSWQPLPWLFRDRGPEVPRRFVAQHCRCDMSRTLIPIWDQQQQQMVLAPFDATIDSWQAMRYERLLQMQDKQLLQYMSTSPDHEPDWFAQDMRNMMQWLLAAQEPHSPERRAASSTHRYRYADGAWRLVHEAALTPGAAGAGAAAAAAAVSGPS